MVEAEAGAGEVKLSDILNNIFEAIKNIIAEIAESIKENASVIGQILVLGGLAIAMVTFGRRVFAQVSGLFRGFF